jgi:RHH-type proline utilization regulon transcriptional repressor/proline dehydrogenase/delta 1-pyrroline-5-carboxylate dehydrogenase
MFTSKRERRIREIARQLASYKQSKPGIYQIGGLNQLILRSALKDPSFRVSLFRLVDVFPMLETDDLLIKHVVEYLTPYEPLMFRLGQEFLLKSNYGRSLIASLARKGILDMANQFIAGTDSEHLRGTAASLLDQGFNITVDLLGEKILTASESKSYIANITEIHESLVRLVSEMSLPVSSISISLKPSAVSTHWAPLARSRAVEEGMVALGELLKQASEAGTVVFLDMEHYDTYELSLELFSALLADSNYNDLQIGIVLQAYLRRHPKDLSKILELAATHQRRAKPWIRLVKGAYWDTEVAQASYESNEPPVYLDKAATDIAYEHSVEELLRATDIVKPAFGTHNLRSISCAMAAAEELGLGTDTYEFQMLYGMSSPLDLALRSVGQAVRIYAPVGDLIPGMSYLVRRLLENTSNTSFVRARYGQQTSIRKLVAKPRPNKPSLVSADDIPKGYKHCPATQFRHREEIEVQLEAIKEVEAGLAAKPINLGGEAEGGFSIASVMPADPDVVLATVPEKDLGVLDSAINKADELVKHQPLPSAQLVEILRRVAKYLQLHRKEIVATEVLEAAKPWIEADNDVAEAIDFCNYYSFWLEILSKSDRLSGPLGETNRLLYRPRGVTAVIPPWNFPLAIPMGMTAAALAMGNPVVLKPAEQTPLTARFIVQAFKESGLPEEMLIFAPGTGERVGRFLVDHPLIATIAFTGSKAVGMEIMERAAHLEKGQRAIKRVIAEMGGKNAIIVDSDADLDQAIPGVIYSAFGFAGQKCSACSRVVTVGTIHNRFLDRLREATAELIIGDPRNSEVSVPPVIDPEAQARIIATINHAESVATPVTIIEPPESNGYYVPIAIYTEPDTNSSLYREEIFGPVLVVENAESLEAAIQRANDTDYALTQGIYSRTPSHINYATNMARAGNFYVNRPITGAIPGRQPFGGFGHSGVGFKAGGPSYLLQFSDQQVVSENLIRQGFSPDVS